MGRMGRIGPMGSTALLPSIAILRVRRKPGRCRDRSGLPGSAEWVTLCASGCSNLYISLVLLATGGRLRGGRRRESSIGNFPQVVVRASFPEKSYENRLDRTRDWYSAC